jgi:hypothetical protein
VNPQRRAALSDQIPRLLAGAVVALMISGGNARGVRGRHVRDHARDRLRGRLAAAMADDDSLDRLSSKELHDLAVDRAKHHLDVKFFWDLMKLLPAAEAAAGEWDETEADVLRMSAHLDDMTDSGRGEVADNLRPFYLEYLREHGVTAP